MSLGLLTGRLAINSKDLALGVRCMGPVGALEVHFLCGKLRLGRETGLRGPELLPWLGLLSILDSVDAWAMHFVAGFLEVKTCVRRD